MQADTSTTIAELITPLSSEHLAIINITNDLEY